jgi:general secretion pathway protein K
MPGRSVRKTAARGPMKAGQDQRGFALVLVLLVTALLTALTAEFINEVYVDTSARQNYVDGQQASLLAESGITGGIKLLQSTLSSQRYTSLLDPWARPLKIDDPAGSLQVIIEEESGKLNLNYLVSANGSVAEPYHGMLARLLQKLKLPPDLAESATDWIDQDDQPTAAGAETNYYQGLRPPYGAKNGKLDTVEELLLVRGWTPESLEKLRPSVTVYADQPGYFTAAVNVNTAPKELLASLDEQMSDSLADNILEYRKKTPFQTVADLARVPGMETVANSLATRVTTAGAVFRLRSIARVNESSRIIEAVARVGTGSSKILYWREY